VSSLTHVVVYAAIGEGEAVAHLLADGRLRGLVALDTRDAGPKAFCGDVLAACLNHVAADEVEGLLRAAPWRHSEAAVAVVDDEVDSQVRDAGRSWPPFRDDHGPLPRVLRLGRV